MWLDLEIYEAFKDGVRLDLDSYLNQGDKNTYLDEKLVRIYYVHKNKPKKQTRLCDLASSIIGERCLDETEVKESIIEFIKTYPCLWNFKKELEKWTLH